jgi:plastocyanin
VTSRWPLAVATAVVLVSSLTAACGGGDGGGATGTSSSSSPADAGRAPAATVKLQPTTFAPSTVTVKVGDTVEWVWAGGVQHNVNGGDAFKSKLQSKGDFRHTFDKAGSYAYHCDVHPTTMKATVEVSDS